jgi:hypothetical protein
MLSRLSLMASGDDQWDLSDNDRAAIRYALDQLRVPRPASPSLEAAPVDGLKLVLWTFKYAGPGPLRDAVTWIEKVLAGAALRGEGAGDKGEGALFT